MKHTRPFLAAAALLAAACASEPAGDPPPVKGASATFAARNSFEFALPETGKDVQICVGQYVLEYATPRAGAPAPL
jgi:hypothetical protein